MAINAVIPTHTWFLARTLLVLCLLFNACSSAPPKSRRVIGNSSTAPSSSDSVLGLADLFLSFSSNDSSSELWLARSASDIKSLIQWNDGGRVLWSATRGNIADFLLEFAPKGNHRIELVRVTCAQGECGTQSQQRGLVVRSKLVPGIDGSSVLLDEKSLTVYPTVTDLMRDTGTRTLRLLPASDQEIVAQSKAATLIMTNPEQGSGELLRSDSHSRFELTLQSGAKPTAIELAGNLRLAIEDKGQTQLWDCPGSVFNGQTDCTVYQAPADFSQAVSIDDTDCGVVVTGEQRIWLIRTHALTEELFPATGIVRCDNDWIVSYRKGQVDYTAPKRQPVVPHLAPLAFHYSG